MIKNNKIFDTRWLVLAVAFTAVVVVLTHLPREVMPPQLQAGGLDKLQHFFAYGIITLLFVLSLRNAYPLLSALALLASLAVIAAFDELTQPLFDRIASSVDWWADLSGIITTLLVFLFLQSWRSRVATGIDS
jgi:VanZ family protein